MQRWFGSVVVPLVLAACAALSCTLDSEGSATPGSNDASPNGAPGSGGTSPIYDGGTSGTGGWVEPDGSAGSRAGGSAGEQDAPSDANDDVVEPDVVQDVVGDVEQDAPGLDAEAGADVAEEPPPICDDLFGTASEYVYCEETAVTCKFAAHTDGGTCTQMCQSLGAKCVNAWDNAGDPCVVISLDDTCDTGRGTEICECSRP